ncbi:MAG: CBS domain-containing protein [Gammaproteobacteria bacterium]|nr:CBS domain-containing protein [Gammaproteobacteria bacterium]
MNRDTIIDSIMVKDVVSVDIAEPLGNVAKTMLANHIRHMPVLENGKLAGVISSRDVCLMLPSAFLQTPPEPCQKFMNAFSLRDILNNNNKAGVRSVKTGEPARNALQIMIENKMGCVPVVDEAEHLVGIISEYDMLCLFNSNLNRRNAPE